MHCHGDSPKSQALSVPLVAACGRQQAGPHPTIQHTTQVAVARCPNGNKHPAQLRTAAGPGSAKAVRKSGGCKRCAP
jgi:hypothetical protein